MHNSKGRYVSRQKFNIKYFPNQNRHPGSPQQSYYDYPPEQPIHQEQPEVFYSQGQYPPEQDFRQPPPPSEDFRVFQAPLPPPRALRRRPPPPPPLPFNGYINNPYSYNLPPNLYEGNSYVLPPSPEALIQEVSSTLPSTSTIFLASPSSLQPVSTSQGPYISSAGLFLTTLGIALVFLLCIIPLGGLLYYFIYGCTTGRGGNYFKKVKEKVKKHREDRKERKKYRKMPPMVYDTSEDTLGQHLPLVKTHEKRGKDTKQPPHVSIDCDECVFTMEESCPEPEPVKKCSSRLVTTRIPISDTSSVRGLGSEEEVEIFARYDNSRPVVDHAKVKRYHISSSEEETQRKGGMAEERTLKK